VSPILAIRDLVVSFPSAGGSVRAVDGVGLSIEAARVLALVGESGSGKSLTGAAIIGLVPPPGRIAAGSIRFAGEELVGRDEGALRRLRGGRIATVLQDPMTALNPVLQIGTQMTEAVRAHGRVGRAEARERAGAMLARVGIADAATRLRSFPHQLSGGMRQRVAIAIALLNGPDLVIADEPTTALDVTLQAQILAEMQALARDTATAILWITHDLSVVAGFADSIAVMYAGRIVEQGEAREVLAHPIHPYTAGLIASVPGWAGPGARLRSIPGLPPLPGAAPSGCPFRDRCAQAASVCASPPPPVMRGGSVAWCHRPLPG